METRMEQLRQKEIVNLKDGAKLGYADDLAICTETAQVKALIVCGRPRLFGLLGHSPDLLVPWDKIRTIGEDTILVEIEQPPEQPFFRKFNWREFWK